MKDSSDSVIGKSTDNDCNCQQDESKIIQQLREILPEISKEKGALIPALQTTQNLLGYVSEEAMTIISEELGVPFSEVAGVVTFYSYFSTVPRGKNVVRVCLGTACYVRGGKEVLSSFKNQLGIDIGGTTDDRMFSLEVGRCFGACGLAPVVMINDDVHQRVKPSKIKDIISVYKNETMEVSS